MSTIKSRTFPTLVIQSQRGSMLLEALIGIIIFSLGVLGLMGLQAASIRNTSEAKYRSDAAFLADKIIAQMWVADPLQRNTQYNGTTGCPTSPGANPYQVWCREVITNLPNRAGTTPLPRIVINRLVGAPNPDDLVTVTVTWQTSTDPASHQYVATARINSKNY